MAKRQHAAVLALWGLVGMSQGLHAQTRPIEAWRPPQGELDPAKRVPTQTEGQHQVAPGSAHVQGTPQAEPLRVTGAPELRETPSRGGAFVGVAAGKGWVYDNESQSARQISAGYRWQAGPVALLGVEVAGGKLSATSDGPWVYDAVDFASIGFTGRFNFGRHSPVYGLVRSGYWSADTSVGNGQFRADVDGGYVGIGLGTDIGRHLSLSLTFTSYVYFNELYWDGDDLVYDANRADTLTFGAEYRF